MDHCWSSNLPCFCLLPAACCGAAVCRAAAASAATDLHTMQAFDGPVPETLNGRLCMLSIPIALWEEWQTGTGMWEQVRAVVNSTLRASLCACQLGSGFLAHTASVQVASQWRLPGDVWLSSVA